MSYPKVYRRQSGLDYTVMWYLLFDKPGESVRAVASDGQLGQIWTEAELHQSSYYDVTNEPEVQEALHATAP